MPQSSLSLSCFIISICLQSLVYLVLSFFLFVYKVFRPGNKLIEHCEKQKLKFVYILRVPFLNFESQGGSEEWKIKKSGSEQWKKNRITCSALSLENEERIRKVPCSWTALILLVLYLPCV